MIRAVIHGAQRPPEGSRPNAHYQGTGTSPRLPGGAAAAAATRLLTSRHERRGQLAPPNGTRRRPYGPRPPRLPPPRARSRYSAVPLGEGRYGLTCETLNRLRYWHFLFPSMFQTFPHENTACSANNRCTSSRWWWSLQFGMAGLCQSSFIVVKQAKNGQWRMLTYTEGI